MECSTKRKRKQNPNFHKAVLEKDIIGIKNLILTSPETINKGEWIGNGWTALHYAAEHGYASIVKLLLTCKGIDINCRTTGKHGNTPLFMAAAENNLSVVEILLKHPSIDVNCQTGYGVTPLMVSVGYRGDIKMMKLFLDHKKIKINIRNESGSSACAYTETCQQIKFFISRGANCEKWRDWYKSDEKYDTEKLTKEKQYIYINWRSFRPEWKTWTHKYYTSKEFDKLVVTCLCVFNRLNKTVNMQISKDIRHLLINYIGENWRKKVD